MNTSKVSIGRMISLLMVQDIHNYCNKGLPHEDKDFWVGSKMGMGMKENAEKE